MATLARSVFVRDPKKHRDILLRAGEEPAPEYAALIRNPACWENGELPETATSGQDSKPQQDDATETAPADSKPAARKPAAKKPARGRNAADEGTSGD
jgi:hypothetical protein